jgi:phenylalanyl-tRNA synthetase beta chain
MGNTFFAAADGGLPEERIALSLGLYGGAGAGFFQMKGALEALFQKLGLTLSCQAEREAAAWHPGRCARVLADGVSVGLFGEIRSDVAERYGIETRCCAGEIDLETLLQKADVTRRYTALPKDPAVERDVALLAAESVTVRQIEDVIWEADRGMLESARLFDVYRGDQVGAGMKSVAFHLVYRSAERTLTDEEVGAEYDRMLQSLEKNLNAALRL